MTGPSKKGDYLRQDRHDRLLRELEHDPYHSKRKLSEPTVCPDCGAVFHKGRWQWGNRPDEAEEILCPACHRIHDKVPAAFLRLSGEFFQVHREEIMNLVHNQAEREKQEHPLKRIMGVGDEDNETVLQLTDAHLARGIGEALQHAYDGELDFKYTQEDIMLRVTWVR